MLMNDEKIFFYWNLYSIRVFLWVCICPIGWLSLCHFSWRYGLHISGGKKAFPTYFLFYFGLDCGEICMIE